MHPAAHSTLDIGTDRLAHTLDELLAIACVHGVGFLAVRLKVLDAGVVVLDHLFVVELGCHTCLDTHLLGLTLLVGCSSSTFLLQDFFLCLAFLLKGTLLLL